VRHGKREHAVHDQRFGNDGGVVLQWSHPFASVRRYPHALACKTSWVCATEVWLIARRHERALYLIATRYI